MAFTQYSEENTVAKTASTPSKSTTEQTPFIEYNNRMVVFAPLYQSYERTKPNAFYWGLIGYVTNTINEKGSEETFIQADFRLGYNYFCNGRDHLTPYVGVGFIKAFFHHHFARHNPGVLFGELGFLYDHEFNRCFNLGINAKGLVGGAKGSHRWRERTWGHGAVFGFDVGVPFTFRFGRNRHWDFRLEPFNVYLHGSKHHHNYFGFRNAFAYRF
jgi:hypothetical protein